MLRHTNPSGKDQMVNIHLEKGPIFDASQKIHKFLINFVAIQSRLCYCQIDEYSGSESNRKAGDAIRPFHPFWVKTHARLNSCDSKAQL
jgi:hypothetical protein